MSCGFIAINKPQGVSSAFVVGKVKYAFKNANIKAKIGHMGTLDLEAEGLLVLAVGNATKLFDLFLNKEKTYQTIFKFGIQTDTDDFSGKIISSGGKIPTILEIEKGINFIKSQTTQLPPIFCANKIDGVRAYDLARQGKNVNLQPKPIKIFDMKFLRKVSKDEFMFEICCSSGTYIRSICRDMAQFLSTFGITSNITRTKCGVLCLNDSIDFKNVSMEQIAKKMLKPSQVLKQFKVIFLDEQILQKLKNGQVVEFKIEDGIYFAQYNSCDKMVVEAEKGFIKQKVFLED